MKRPITTRERLEARESELGRHTLFPENTGAIDAALHLVSKASLSETELEKLRDQLHAASVSHNLPKLDPRVAKPGLGYTEEELKGLPSETAFHETLLGIRGVLFVKKDAILAENRIAMRRDRGFAKARKAIHNLLRNHSASARRTLEAMAKGGPMPSWVIRSVAVAAKPN